MEPVNVAIIYYSATGAVYALARAAAEGAEKTGAQVRLRTVAELAAPEAINSNPAWAQHRQNTADVEQASLDDIAWADAVLFGTPSRFGTPAGQLKAFIDGTGSLWREGKLAGKVYSAFTSAGTAHGGHESTLLPYGTSHQGSDGPPSETTLEAARYQARRVAEVATALKAGRAA